ncbi:ER membrane protein complex subunit 2 [Holothuria leucospilota]|uniref:ER membrane protein complex subunit 2 n=1 Tax=Holothuria leucospilota TaxID=206669 RepID=A0A9Q0YEG7_HOLLE|nr:ER membrane protein complex subunit 2 [Holothuria leucospilota]
MAATMNFEDVRDKLRKWREDKVRNSVETADLGEYLLANYRRKLGDEVWPLYEQVSIAALDCGRLSLARLCIHAVRQQFPHSSRSKRLHGMLEEAEGEFDKARETYNDILKDDPANGLVMKRLIAIHKGQNDIPGAIKELNKYIENFMSDSEAWMELAELYIQEQHYSKAAFCFEELILSNPHHHLYHQRYAEIMYTQGGPENLEIARKYFAQAVKLNSNNMRALYGMFLSASHLAASSKATIKKKTENTKYASWAAAQIAHKYKQAEPQVEVVGEMLDKLAITSGN